MGIARGSMTMDAFSRAFDLGRRFSRATFAVMVDQTAGRLLDTDPVAVKIG